MSHLSFVGNSQGSKCCQPYRETVCGQQIDADPS